MSLLSHKARVTLLVIIIGVVMISTLVLLKPKTQREPRTAKPLLAVEVIVASPTPLKVSISSQGTVAPKREIDLVSQVSGKIVAVADNYANGGFFQAEEKLVQIESADYEFAVVRAKAQLARAEEQVALEQGRSRQAKREWRDLGDKTANKLFLRQPQLNAAKAGLDSAHADLQKAELDLARTGISAPFQGRIRNTVVDLGQYIRPGERVAKVYSTDVVEVRLPLSDREAMLVNLPVNFEDSRAVNYPAVTLRSRVGDLSYEWLGKIVRTDASIDVQSRMTFAVAEVRNPFKADIGDDRPPLNIGLFVEADINSRVIENALRLPKEIVYRGREILVLNDDNEINFQTISVLRSNASSVVAVGIAAGTRIVATRISLPINGMRVAPILGSDIKSIVQPTSSAGQEL
jgi:RND family efflux transporter MFP subunit